MFLTCRLRPDPLRELPISPIWIKGGKAERERERGRGKRVKEREMEEEGGKERGTPNI